MGTSNFDQTIYTTKSMQDAYTEACEDAVYMDGHSGDNGTISTTRGVQASPLSSTPVREDQVDWEAISQRRHSLKKRGVCEALPIKEVQAPQYREVGVIEVEARMPSALFERGADHGERRTEAERVFLREARKALKAGVALHPLHPALGRTASTVTADGVSLSALEVHRVAVAPEAESQSTSTRATSGKVETRYFILREDQQTMPRWESGFASQAEARARLPKALSDSSRFPRERFEVISMSRRVSGEPLVVHEVSLAGRGKTVPVRLKGRLMERTQVAKVTGRKGWLFYGWVAD